MRLKIYVAPACTALLLCIVIGQVVFAHETEKHQADQGMSSHMKEMYALKDAIPEEYRIMERTPIIPDEKSLQQGQNLFEQSCAFCHGKSGDGKGPAATAMSTPPANFLDKKHSAIYGAGEKYWIIGNGSGKTGMPGFPHIDPLDRWHLVNYILHLQQNSTTKPMKHGHH